MKFYYENLDKCVFFIFEPNLNKGLWPHFMIARFVQNFFSLLVHNLTIFDPLIQRSFWVFLKLKLVI